MSIPCERKWTIQFAGPPIIGPPPNIVTPYTATGADLDQICELVALGVTRAPNEDDESLRHRMLREWDFIQRARGGFGTPAIRIPIGPTCPEDERTFTTTEGCNGCGTCPACLRYQGNE